RLDPRGRQGYPRRALQRLGALVLRRRTQRRTPADRHAARAGAGGSEPSYIMHKDRALAQKHRATYRRIVSSHTSIARRTEGLPAHTQASRSHRSIARRAEGLQVLTQASRARADISRGVQKDYTLASEVSCACAGRMCVCTWFITGT